MSTPWCVSGTLSLVYDGHSVRGNTALDIRVLGRKPLILEMNYP